MFLQILKMKFKAFNGPNFYVCCKKNLMEFSQNTCITNVSSLMGDIVHMDYIIFYYLIGIK